MQLPKKPELFALVAAVCVLPMLGGCSSKDPEPPECSTCNATIAPPPGDLSTPAFQPASKVNLSRK